MSRLDSHKCHARLALAESITSHASMNVDVRVFLRVYTCISLAVCATAICTNIINISRAHAL